jgi:hypothetical protein
MHHQPVSLGEKLLYSDYSFQDFELHQKLRPRALQLATCVAASLASMGTLSGLQLLAPNFNSKATITRIRRNRFIDPYGDEATITTVPPSPASPSELDRIFNTDDACYLLYGFANAHESDIVRLFIIDIPSLRGGWQNQVCFGYKNNFMWVYLPSVQWETALEFHQDGATVLYLGDLNRLQQEKGKPISPLTAAL